MINYKLELQGLDWRKPEYVGVAYGFSGILYIYADGSQLQ